MVVVPPQDPPEQAWPPAHCADVVQLVKHAVVSQVKGAHAAVTPDAQVPAPLQVAAEVSLPPEHEAAVQTVPEGQRSQAPPEHLPSVPQVEAAVAAHRPRGSVAAFLALPQVPSAPDCLSAAEHASQAPLHAALQQTPSTQKALAHSLPAPQAAPSAFVVAWHAPEMQFCPAPQAVAHVPQWLLSLAVLVSQPLLGLPSQLPKPAAQEG